MKKYCSILLMSLLACQSPLRIDGFDSESWQKDKGGCLGQREVLLADFKQKVKPKLEGVNEKQLISLLGKPDFKELSKRGQTFYFYFLEKGVHCSAQQADFKLKHLQIRFDALDKVNEVSLLNP
jgi:hypothetical protein